MVSRRIHHGIGLRIPEGRGAYQGVDAEYYPLGPLLCDDIRQDQNYRAGFRYRRRVVDFQEESRKADDDHRYDLHEAGISDHYISKWQCHLSHEMLSCQNYLSKKTHGAGHPAR